MKLGEISKIQSGLILSRKRARSELEKKKEYKILTLHNIEPHGDFNECELESFYSNDPLEDHYFTEVGDVLLRLNEPFTAVCIQKHQAGILIPSYFVSIKVMHDDYVPAYVSWYLNTDNVKRIFHKTQSGTMTPNINQKIIRNLTIPKRPRADQEKITKVHELYLRERRLLNDLIHQKDRYYEAITNKIIQEKWGSSNGKDDTRND